MDQMLTLAARRGRERLILKDAGLTAAEVRVLMALASHANTDGLAWPSDRTFRLKYHVGGRVIQRALAKAVRNGHFAPAGVGPNGVRRWRLLPPNGDPGAPTAGAPADAGRAPPGPSAPTASAPDGPGGAQPGPQVRPSGPQGAPIQTPTCAHGGRRRVKEEEVYEEKREEGRPDGPLPGQDPPAGEQALAEHVLSLLFKRAATKNQKDTTLDNLDRLRSSGVTPDFIREHLPACLAKGIETPWKALDEVARQWKADRTKQNQAHADRQYDEEFQQGQAKADREALERLGDGPYGDLYLKVRDGAKVRAQRQDLPHLAGLIECRSGALRVHLEKSGRYTELAEPDLAAGLWILDPPPADVRPGPQSESLGGATGFQPVNHGQDAHATSGALAPGPAGRITVASGRPDPILGRP